MYNPICYSDIISSAALHIYVPASPRRHLRFRFPFHCLSPEQFKHQYIELAVYDSGHGQATSGRILLPCFGQASSIAKPSHAAHIGTGGFI
jgi:hypothetical protein